MTGCAPRAPYADGDPNPARPGGRGVDHCALLTDEEVSALAGKRLESGVDSALGCPWVAPGEAGGDFALNTFRASQSAAEYGAELVPSAEVIPIDDVVLADAI